ncbi:MAG: tetratricopeptide repeat protein [Candidatus Zixiibacteriota bacterium]
MRFFIAAILSGLLLVAGCAKKPAEEAERLYQLGLEQLGKLQFTRADSTFALVTRTDSTSVMGAFGHALNLERRLAVYDALHSYLIIAERRPDFAPAFAGAARVYEVLGDHLEASHVARRYALLSPNNVEAQFVLARIALSAGLYQTADTAIQNAGKVGLTKPTADLLQARQYLLENRFQAAEALAATALVSTETDPLFLTAAADYLEQRGWPDSAMAVSRRSIGGAPEAFDRMMDHFRRDLRVGYLSETARLIDSLKPIDSSRVLTTGMSIYQNWAAGDNRHADLASAEYIRLMPFHLTPLLYDARTRQLIGDSYSTTQNLDDITVYLAKIQPCEEFKDFMMYYTSVWFAQLPDRLLAIDKMRRVSGWRGNKREFKVGLAQSQYASGMADEYKALRDSILQFRGNDPSWLTALGVACADRLVHLYADAEADFKQALAVAPENRPAFEQFAKMYTDQKQFDVALKRFDEYPFFARTFPELAVTRAWCLVGVKQVDAGVKLFAESIPYVKGNLAAFDRMEDALTRLDATTQARGVIDLMNRLNPDNPDAEARTAEYELDHGNYQAALEWADKAVAKSPDIIKASAIQAAALYGVGRREDAFKLFDEILARDDGDVETNLRFSRILAEEKVDTKRAGNMARQAVFYDRSSLRTQMNLCDVYIKSGRYDLARGEALKAIGNYPDEPLPQYFLGMAMYHEKNAGARKQLEKAIAMGLYGTSLESARETLTKL